MENNQVKLNNGEVVNVSEIRVEKIRGELPRFLQIAVGREKGDKWYVQTTDVLEGTMLSQEIKGNLSSYFEAKKLAENISAITGMEINYWDNLESFEDVVNCYQFDNWLDVNYEHDEEDDQPSSSARFYALFNGAIDKEKMLEYYGFNQNDGIVVYDLHRNETHVMYEFIKYFRGCSYHDLKETLFKMKDVVTSEKNTSDSYTNIVDLLETENKYKSVEMYLKSKDIDLVPKGTSVWENGAFAIHEALQGYVRHNETFKEGDIYPYSDEGRFFDKTFSSVIVSIDEESNSMLLRHEFEIPNLLEFQVKDVIDSVEDVLNDMQESEFNLYVDDTYAWDRYEGFIAHPTLTSEEVDELKQVAETLNTLRNTLEYMNGNNNMHEKTLNNLIGQLDDVYEDVYKFYDEFKK